jgi:hypothetical protein
MIIKSLSRHSAGGISGLINYILDEKKAEENEKPKPYLHNFKGTTKSQWVKELYQNEAFRVRERKGQIYYYHFILSFSNLDSKISGEIINDITEKFIAFRGKEGMYLAASHHDKEHTHIHCLVSALEYRTGKAFRMTKQEFKEFKIQLETYQREMYPELIHSHVNHSTGKEYMTAKESSAKIKNSKSYIKAQLAAQVNELFSQSSNQQSFLENLASAGLHYYERGGRPYGITTEEGKNYRFKVLGIKIGELEQDLTQEEIALCEIEQIRNDSNLLKNKDIEPDIDR